MSGKSLDKPDLGARNAEARTTESEDTVVRRVRMQGQEPGEAGSAEAVLEASQADFELLEFMALDGSGAEANPDFKERLRGTLLGMLRRTRAPAPRAKSQPDRREEPPARAK